MIKINGICKKFGENEILKNIDFHIKEGEFVAVMGQSGCGKSTLLYSISGMDKPTGGQVLFEGKKLYEFSEKEMEKLRLNRMGFIFQKANFLKNLSIEDNIVFPAFQAGKKSRGEVVKEAEKLMEQMGILHIAKHDIRKVSGGQLQRAAICRAMINHPAILYGDEPTGALNSSATREVMDIINRINKQGTTVLLVTHDAKVAARADRVIYLEDGRLKEALELGKFVETTAADREEKLKEWLEKMGF
ncbi:ABC transporter ATP-binding protein [Roseburia sp. 499]|uniref:ABC transporter ATP-binding protein n=1 Tax=Roseburia sp. 499 TaxID=1261634 RepID=UPI0009514134|nr:ABC transporter ATP-binding protein [Roseburia sp. 499]WVK71178.1 ABC transporter ATP-binding protein [Roseburia sp. 499]